MLTINIMLNSNLPSPVLNVNIIALSSITFIGILIGIVLLLSVVAIIVVLNPGSLKSRTKSIKVPVGNADNAVQTAGPEYQMIIERIMQIEIKYKCILLAASKVTSLPTTIPVNTAIHFASNGRKCLLIDLDLKRDAVAMVFDIKPLSNTQALRPTACETAIENLTVWPAHNFTKSNQMNIKPLVDAAMEKYDIVLINAPTLDSSPDRNQIAATAQCAIIFAAGASQTKRLTDILRAVDCKIIGSLQMTKQTT